MIFRFRGSRMIGAPEVHAIPSSRSCGRSFRRLSWGDRGADRAGIFETNAVPGDVSDRRSSGHSVVEFRYRTST